MEETNDSQSPFDRRTSSPMDSGMNWQTVLSQSEPSIRSRPTLSLHRLSTTACNSSYRVSIGQETVNITEIARHFEPIKPSAHVEHRRAAATRQGANILSLCFICFVCTTFILISISTIQLLLKTNHLSGNGIPPFLVPSSGNLTANLLYLHAPGRETVSNQMVPLYDRTIRETATVVCILIIVLNCFCLLTFSIEIYLACNLIRIHRVSQSSFYNSSTARFTAICCFYASVPAFIFVMCLFILLNMSMVPAIVALSILGIGLLLILLTLLTYFFTWSTKNGELTGMDPSIYHTIDADIDVAPEDQLSTLV